MNDPVSIGKDRQLFLDDFWIDDAKVVERRLHQPVPREIAIASEKPWEGRGVCYLVAIPDGEGYRGWYRCDPPGGAVDAGSITAYAESDDGIRWEKPDVGALEFEGSTDNNLVWTGPGINFAPFRDENPDAPDNERYKSIVRDKKVLLALASPDGLNWHKMQEEPVLTNGPFDTLNIPFWDTWRGEYVMYVRGVAGGTTPEKREHDISIWKETYRWIRRTTSPDFINWGPMEIVDPGGAPYEDLYTNSCVQYERAPSTYLMFPSRFIAARSPDPDWPTPGLSDIVFMSSRDGINFDRSFMEAFVRPGLEFSNWHERGIYMECGVLQTSPEEISLFGMEHKDLPTMRIRRYSLRTDGFVSMNAGFDGGEFTTHPMLFEGSELELNYSTSAVGSVRVEIQDADGNALPGFGLEDCPEKFGDEIEGVMTWKGGASLGDLAGKPVRLRVALKDADLYAFRFR